MDEQMIEPKECPLCSDKDEFNPSVSTSYKYAHPGTASTDLVEAGHFIECDKCACCGPIKPTEEEAIAAWNTRAAHSVIAGKVVELTEALKDARQAIDTLDEDAFGLVMHHHTGNPLYPVRDELLAKIDAALAPYPERRSE